MPNSTTTNKTVQYSAEERKEYLKLLKKRKKREFLAHLIVYCVMIVFLTFVNLYTVLTTRIEADKPVIAYLWVLWVIVGWGIGVALHGVQVYTTNYEEEMRFRELSNKLGLDHHKEDDE